MGSWSVPLRGWMVGDREVYGLMKCPIMWGRRARDRVLYGLMECPIVGQAGEGSRGEPLRSHQKCYITQYDEPQ